MFVLSHVNFRKSVLNHVNFKSVFLKKPMVPIKIFHCAKHDENMSISARSGITITKLTPMIRFVKYRQKTRQNRKQENETAIKEEIQEDLVGTHEETEKEHLYSFTRFSKASQM